MSDRSVSWSDLKAAVANPDTADLPLAPEGWQYAVVMKDNTVWGCGAGDGGRCLQRIRLRYSSSLVPCLVPINWDKERD